MENWKRALIAGSAGVATILLMKGKPTAALVLAGVGVATLAAEYPDKFAEVRDNLDHYVDRGTRFFEVATRLGEHWAEVAEKRGVNWYEALLNN
jgi:hypothetical protein